MSERVTFTGERLHAGSKLYGVDLARHRAAYAFATPLADGMRVLELGCGTGYGAAELAPRTHAMLAIDRIPPDPEARECRAHFVRATFEGLPLDTPCFDLIISFQVIEHLEDPSEYLQAIGRLLAPGGLAILTTPNARTSDGENPFHVHEYTSNELSEVLARHFGGIQMHGVGLSAKVAPYFEARLARIRRITALDPLGLRRILPRALIEWLFAAFSKRVRRGIQSDQGIPDAGVEDFPIGPATDECIDLLAVCRDPIGPPSEG